MRKTKGTKNSPGDRDGWKKEWSDKKKIEKSETSKDNDWLYFWRRHGKE